MSEFSRRLGISPSGYLNYERGERAIPSDVLVQIAICANVNVHWLLTGKGVRFSDQGLGHDAGANLQEKIIGPKADRLPKSSLAVEGVHHRRFLYDYWPALRPWVTEGELNLWLIGDGDSPPLGLDRSDQVVYLNCSSSEYARIITNLSVDAFLLIGPCMSLTSGARSRYPQTPEFIVPLEAVKDRFRSRTRNIHRHARFVDPYWIQAFPFYQNLHWMLEQVGGAIHGAEIVLYPGTDTGSSRTADISMPGMDTLLCNAVCLMALIGDVNCTRTRSIQVSPASVEIMLELTGHTGHQAAVCLKLGAGRRRAPTLYLQLMGESGGKPALRLDFLTGWISLQGENTPPLFLMPMPTEPYRFYLDRLISGELGQNSCDIPTQTGMDILRLYRKLKSCLEQQANERACAQVSSTVFGSPFPTGAAMTDSLPLTQSDQRYLDHLIERGSSYLNQFQSVLHPTVVARMNAAIESDIQGGISCVPRLVKHSLVRATIGTTTALLIGEIVFNLVVKSPEEALCYAQSIPDELFSDKSEAFYAVISRFALQGKEAEAFDLIDEALALVHRQDDRVEVLKGLLIVARWCALSNAPEQAESLMVRIREALQPDLAPQEILLKFRRQLAEIECALGHLHRADELLDEVLDLGREILTEPIDLDIHLSRCFVQYARVSLELHHMGHVSEASAIMRKAGNLIPQIQDPFHQVEALTEGVKGYYHHLVNSPLPHAQLAHATELARAIADPQRQAFALSRTIECLVDLGDMEAAEELAQLIADPVEAASAFLSIARVYMDQGLPERARPFLDDALRLSEKVQGTQAQNDILQFLIFKLVRQHETQAAFKLALQRAAGDDRLNVLVQIIAMIVTAENRAWVAQELDSLVERAYQLTDVLAQARVLRGAASVYQSVGITGNSEELVAKANEIAPSHREATHELSVTPAPESQNESDGSSALTSSGTLPLQQASALTQKCLYLAEQNRRAQAIEAFEEAMTLIEQIGLAGNRARLASQLAMAAILLENSEQALDLLQRALRDAARSTRETTIEVICTMLPVMRYLGGDLLLQDVYVEFAQADAIFGA